MRISRMLSAVGVGVWFLVGAAPAHAVELPALTVPTVPPVVVAPVQVDVGPVRLDPKVAVSPSPPAVVITTPAAPAPSVAPAPAPAPTPPRATPARHAVLPAPVQAVAAAPTPSPLHHAAVAPRAHDVSNARVTGAIVAPMHHSWTQWLGTAAHSYGVLLLLLLGALAFRFFMVAALRGTPAPKRL